MFGHFQDTEERLGGVSVSVLDVLLEVAGGGEGERTQFTLDSFLKVLRLDMIHHVGGFLTGLHFQIREPLRTHWQ